MKIQKDKLEVALARACMNARDLRNDGISSNTIVRAMRGEELTSKTVGKIARTLGVDVLEIISKEA